MRSALAFVLLIVALAVSSIPAYSDAQGASTEPVGAVGIWQGTLQAPGAQLRLIVKIRDDAGALTGTLDSIDQGARDLPIDTIRFAGGKLEFEMRAIGGRFAGALAAGGEIVGTWSQGGGSLPLTLRRDANVPVVARPQEPTRPLPYREQEVSYDSEPGVRLAATLTLPAGQGPFPAVVLITGSGPQDRDESLLGHRPFYILADSLTRRGIAVLRADDRGFAKSTGDFAAASSEAFATDALAGVGYLAARSDIRADAIGLVGHSEGGLVAPLAATRDAPETQNIAFLVLLSGPGVPLGEILIEQNRLILAASGAPTAVIDTQVGMLERLIEVALNEADRDRAATAMRSALTDFAATLPEAARAQIAARIEPQVQQMNSVWMRWALAYDPMPALRALDVPVLALFAERDLQVPPAQNRAPLEAALREAGHPKSLVVELPGLNHLFQTAATGSPAEYATIEETMNPAALNLLGDWITARVAEAR